MTVILCLCVMEPTKYSLARIAGTADLMAIFSIRINSRWRPRPSWIISNGHISATAHDLLIQPSAHRAVIFAIAQRSCSFLGICQSSCQIAKCTHGWCDCVCHVLLVDFPAQSILKTELCSINMQQCSVRAENCQPTLCQAYIMNRNHLLLLIFTARCTLVQSAVLRSHVVCLSVCNVGGL